MISIGKHCQLEVVKHVDFGLYLDGGPFGEILLPRNENTEELEVGQEVDVFIYCDSEDRIIATRRKPKISVGKFAYLQVVDVNEYGAFLEWGLAKDLFCPFREQAVRMKKGQYYVVAAYLDNATDRIVATSKLHQFLAAESEGIATGDKVEIIVAAETDLGFRVIVNDQFWGALYANEIFQPIHIGDHYSAFVKLVRTDKKLDISLQAQGYQAQVPEAGRQILDKLRQGEGFLPLTDKSSPEMIYDSLQMSKKTFKKAVGGLLKRKAIKLEENGIRLLEENNSDL